MQKKLKQEGTKKWNQRRDKKKSAESVRSRDLRKYIFWFSLNET